MTAVTTVASGIAVGAYDAVIAGGVEHMGHHPMGEGADPNPRFVSDRLVDPSALMMGSTAENLHDRYPQLTKDARRRVRGGQPGEVRQGAGQRQDRPRTWSRSPPAREQGWGLAGTDEMPRPGTTVDGLRRPCARRSGRTAG